MKIIFQRKAQSITDYVLLVGIISAALLGLQVYMKRGIQANIKVIADKIGDQKKGAADYDYRYEWKKKGDSETSSSAVTKATTTQSAGGAVSYEKDDTTTQKGVLSWGISQEKK